MSPDTVSHQSADQVRPKASPMILACDHNGDLTIAHFRHLSHRCVVLGQVDDLVVKTASFKRAGCGRALHASWFGVNGDVHFLSLFLPSRCGQRDTKEPRTKRATDHIRTPRPSAFGCRRPSRQVSWLAGRGSAGLPGHTPSDIFSFAYRSQLRGQRRIWRFVRTGFPVASPSLPGKP